MNNGRAVVLIVEDSAIILMGAIDLVISGGYEALEACDADEAIRILESRNDIDLVFTDVQMPGTMDGIKLSHYIRGRWPPVKLIVASGAAILDESSLPVGAGFSRSHTMIARLPKSWPTCFSARNRFLMPDNDHNLPASQPDIRQNSAACHALGTRGWLRTSQTSPGLD